MPLFCGTAELKAGQSFVDSILPCVYTCFSFRIIVLNKRGFGQTSLLKYSGIIMDEKTLLFILLGVVVLLFAICLFCRIIFFVCFSVIFYFYLVKLEYIVECGKFNI